MKHQYRAGLRGKLGFFMGFLLMTMFVFTGVVNAADAPAKVHFIVRNDVNAEGDAWTGTLVDEWVEITDGMTGYDAFVQAMKQEDLEGKFTADDTGYGHFLSEVNGLTQSSDYTNFYGLYVNGESSMVGIDSIEMADGDLVSFVYGPWIDKDEKSGNASHKTAEVSDMYDTVIAATTGPVSDENLGFGGEWPVFIAARAGVIKDAEAGTYYNNLTDAVKENGSALLDEKYATTNARVVLALSSIKKDATDVGGFNLLEPLANLDFIKKQGVNAAAYALLAFDSNNYQIPETAEGTQTTRDKLIDYILGSATKDGGYSYGGDSADPDMTGVVIAALAPYYDSNDKVKTAIDKAIDTLSAMQNDDGSYSSWGAANSDSTAWVITALSTMGIDAHKDPRFKKNGRTVLDALADYYVENEGFTYMSGDNATSPYSNNDVAYALIAYNRMTAGDKTLYDMAWEEETEEEETGEEVAEPTTTVVPAATPASASAGSNTAKTGDASMLPIVIFALVSLSGAVILKKKEA